MRNRGYRRYRKALVKKHIVARAIREYNRRLRVFGLSANQGCYARNIDELPKTGYYRLRRILRHEGRGRSHFYRCGEAFCEICIGNLCHKNKRRLYAVEADAASWKAGDYLSDADVE